MSNRRREYSGSSIPTTGYYVDGTPTGYGIMIYYGVLRYIDLNTPLILQNPSFDNVNKCNWSNYHSYYYPSGLIVNEWFEGYYEDGDSVSIGTGGGNLSVYSSDIQDVRDFKLCNYGFKIYDVVVEYGNGCTIYKDGVPTEYNTSVAVTSYELKNDINPNIILWGYAIPVDSSVLVPHTTRPKDAFFIYPTFNSTTYDYNGAYQLQIELRHGQYEKLLKLESGSMYVCIHLG